MCQGAPAVLGGGKDAGVQSQCLPLCHLQLFPGDKAALVSVIRAACWVRTKTQACFACLEVIRIPTHSNFDIFSGVLRTTSWCASPEQRDALWSNIQTMDASAPLNTHLNQARKVLVQVKHHLLHKHTSFGWKRAVWQRLLKPSVPVLADNMRHRMGRLFLIGLLMSHRIRTQSSGGNPEKNPSCTLVTGRSLSTPHTRQIKSAWNRTSLQCIYIKSTLQPVQHHMP